MIPEGEPKSFEFYSNLDYLGRCGVTYACIGKDIMPTEERGSIGQVKPTGWETIKYEVVDGNYLYNRCHLIGYQLTAENANTSNFITGTRYLNVEGMLPLKIWLRITLQKLKIMSCTVSHRFLKEKISWLMESLWKVTPLKMKVKGYALMFSVIMSSQELP